MVTLGAFACCKVDADVAPVEAGDLLTVSSTRGYAQKLLDPRAPAGAIVRRWARWRPARAGSRYW
jgi:hypothetical protein